MGQGTAKALHLARVSGILAPQLAVISQGPVLKLFISDLDFTLLDTVGDLPRSSALRLNRLIDTGVHFTIATARATPSIKHLMEGVNLRLPIIELNGAIIRDLNTDHILDHKGLGLNDASKAFDCFQEVGLTPFVSGLKGDATPLYFPELKNKGMQWFPR